jgi:hypothetical protein
MWKKIAKFAPAIASFLGGCGLEMSGIEIPWLGYSLMIAAILLLAIPAWPYLKRIHFQNPIKYSSTAKSGNLSLYEQQELEAYQKLMAYDRYHLGDSLVVQNARLSHYSFNTVGGGQLHFTFDVFNGSILEVNVGGNVEGELLANHNNFHDKIEKLESATIPHINWGTVSIKQRVLPQVCGEIITKARDDPDGILLSFNFNDVKIHIDERYPVSTSISQYLKIPEKLAYRIKMRELKMGDSVFGDYEITLETSDS